MSSNGEVCKVILFETVRHMCQNVKNEKLCFSFFLDPYVNRLTKLSTHNKN